MHARNCWLVSACLFLTDVVSLQPHLPYAHCSIATSTKASHHWQHIVQILQLRNGSVKNRSLRLYTFVSIPSKRPIRSMFLSIVAWQVISLAHSIGNQPRSPSRSRSPSYQPAKGNRGATINNFQNVSNTYVRTVYGTLLERTLVHSQLSHLCTSNV